MEGLHVEAILQGSEALISDTSISRVLDRDEDWTRTASPRLEAAKPLIQEDKDCPMGDAEQFAGEYMICDAGSRLIPSGFSRSSCTDEIVMFVNAGGEAPREEDLSIKFLADDYYEGGNVLRTDECINEGGDYPFIYQSARFGNFSYQLNGLAPGDYFVDLHFVEIINTNGPKGMRVFNVFVQYEKVLSDFDIFAIVGANKPLQLVDSRVSVKEDDKVVIRFEGVLGSPVVSGICIRRAPKLSDSQLIHEYVRCRNCAAEIEVPLTLEKGMRQKATAKYENKIEELSIQCQRKTDECYQAWMSLTAANKQLEKVRMELDNNALQMYSLDQKVEKQAEELRTISHRYEHDKKRWMMAITTLDSRIKKMKEEHSQLSHDAHECADSIPELNKMVFAIQSMVAQCEDLKVKYIEEQNKRKKLYNQVQEARGNIRVFCRCRPLTKHEQAAGSATIVDFDGAKDGEVGILTGGSTKKTFKFDRVYTPKDDQGDVFADASPMVISVLDGYNVCIFAYGQTGTGKTFTMEGTVQNRGVNYRTLDQLFEIAKQRSDTFKYNISVSVLEVYNEQIRDLLATAPAAKKLEIKQASSNHVPGIVEANVESIKEAWDVLQTGSNARAVGSNNVNEHSSRSHCMLCVMVRAKNLMNGECTKSKLWLVDLAGSERLAKTDVQGERLKEAQNINRSLSALGDVISALANKSSHIPYRNSKLTHLLQDSLGGDSKTLMFVQISPSEQDLGETLSSLNFASRVRGIDLGLAKRQIDTSELQKTKTLLDKARQESKSKDESIRKLEESLQNLENKARNKDQTCKNQQEKIRELENQIELKATFQSQLEKQLLQLQERLRGREEACTSLQHKVKELENQLEEQEHSDSTALQQVRDLEKKLKDQELESELYSISLQQKVNELEKKLKDEENNTKSSILHEKIKALEDKLRELQEQRMESTLPSIDYALHGATPTMLKPVLTGEMMGEFDPFVLRSSNSSNQIVGHSPFSIKGIEIRNEMRKKRGFRNSDIENNVPIPAPLVQDKKIRKSDPPSRMVMKTVKPAAVSQRLHSHSRMNRDQVQGRETTKKRIWC